MQEEQAQDSELLRQCPDAALIDQDDKESEPEENTELNNIMVLEKDVEVDPGAQCANASTDTLSDEEKSNEDEVEPAQKKLKQRHDEIGVVPTPLRCEMGRKPAKEPESRTQISKSDKALATCESGLPQERCPRKLKQENSYPEEESRMSKKKGKTKAAPPSETHSVDVQPSFRKSQRLASRKTQSHGEEDHQVTSMLTN